MEIIRNLVITIILSLVSLGVIISTEDRGVIMVFSLLLLIMTYLGLLIISRTIIGNIRIKRISVIHEFLMSREMIDILVTDKFNTLSITEIYDYYLNNLDVEVGMSTVYDSIGYKSRSKLIWHLSLPGIRYLFLNIIDNKSDVR